MMGINNPHNCSYFWLYIKHHTILSRLFGFPPTADQMSLNTKLSDWAESGSETALVQPIEVRFYSFIWSASTGLSMKKCVCGAWVPAHRCALSEFLILGVWMGGGGGTKLLVTTDTVWWTEVLERATTRRHCGGRVNCLLLTHRPKWPCVPLWAC